MLDSDMIIICNIDEFMVVDLPSDWIVAAHICACNPRKLAHYPEHRWAFRRTSTSSLHQLTTMRIPVNCASIPLSHLSGHSQPSSILLSSHHPYTLLNSGLIILMPSATLTQSIIDFLHTLPLAPTFSFPNRDLLAAHFQGR